MVVANPAAEALEQITLLRDEAARTVSCACTSCRCGSDIPSTAGAPGDAEANSGRPRCAFGHSGVPRVHRPPMLAAFSSVPVILAASGGLVATELPTGLWPQGPGYCPSRPRGA